MKRIKIGEAVLTKRKGRTLKKEEIEQRVCYAETDNLYVKPNCVENGIINSSVTFLKDIPQCFSGNVAKKNEILIPTIGFPNKIIVLNSEKIKLLPNSIFYILKLDEDILNPFYLASLLNSNKEKSKIEAMYKGLQTHIYIDELLDYEIPLLSLEEQNKIGRLYIEYNNNIKETMKKIEIESEKLRIIIE